MGAQFRRFLAHDLTDPDKYVRVPDVNAFDEHDEVDPRTGKLTRRFTKRDLEEIAAYCNRRDATGTLSPLTLGHTNPREPDEQKQPVGVGYARGWRVAWDADLGKWVLRTTFFVDREHFDRARTFPRVSIELWPGEKGKNGKWIEPPVIDPVSLLRRTPQRDLGQWVYARGDVRNPAGVSRWHFARTGRAVLRYSMTATWTRRGDRSAMPRRFEMDPEPVSREEEAPEHYDAAGDGEYTGATGAGDGDGDADDATGAMGDAGAPTPEMHAKMHSYMKHCAAHPYHKSIMDHYARHYGKEEAALDDTEAAHDLEAAADDEQSDPTDFPDSEAPEAPEQQGMAFASGSNGAIPHGKRRPTGNGRARPVAKIPVAYARRMAELERRAAVSDIKEQYLQPLQREGYDVGAYELKQFAKLPAGKARDEYRDTIRQKYARDIAAPLGRVATATAAHGDEADGQMSERRLEQCLRFAKQNPDMEWDEVMQKAPRK